MISTIVSVEHLDISVDELANTLIQNTSRTALNSTKQMIAQVQELGLDAALQLAAETNANARNTDDCKYGIQSFLEKNKPIWD